MNNFRKWKTLFFPNSNQVKPALIFTESQTRPRKGTRIGKIDFSVFEIKNSNCGTSEISSETKILSTPTIHKDAAVEGIEDKRERMKRIWATRRNGICTEIEKTTFVKGNSLNRLRNNLKATVKLEKKGLLF